MCPTNNGRRPFVEMFEVSQKEHVREAASDQEQKYMGHINQVYMNELPSVLPERYIKKEGFVTLAADYTTGTVTVGTGTTNIVGVGTTWTSAHTNRIIKIDGADVVYRVTYAAALSLTMNDSLTWTGSSGSGLGYSLYQDRHSIASDFSYMAQDNPDDANIVYRYSNGTKIFLEPLENEEFDRQNNGIVGDLWAYTVKWTGSTPYLHTLMGADSADILGYSYIPVLSAMTEHTTGTITFTTGTSVVAAGAPTWSTSVTTGTHTYYIRNDADGTGSKSLWFKVLSVTDDTDLTLSINFTGTSGTGITYTISAISHWPERFDDAIIYKTNLIVDPDNVQSKKWSSLYSEAIGLDNRVEAKRNTGSQLKGFPGLRKY